MGRKKINQAWIADDVVRNTLRNRCKAIWKKIKEFATLCDVGACAVIYGPNDPEPEVWPNVPEATMMLKSFQELPEITQCRKMMDQETFLQEKLTKILQQNQTLEYQIQELENSTLIYEFMSGRDMDEPDLQEARKAYCLAGYRLKLGYEQMQNTMAVHGSSSDSVNHLPLINNDYDLDNAISSYINELTLQNQNQMVSSGFNHQNQLSAPNLNQQFMIQRRFDNYAENQNQMMIVPYVNGQMMHQQAAGIGSVVGTSSNNMAIASNVNQQLMMQQSINDYIPNPNQAPNVQNEWQAMASSSAGRMHQQSANDYIHNPNH